MLTTDDMVHFCGKKTVYTIFSDLYIDRLYDVIYIAKLSFPTSVRRKTPSQLQEVTCPSDVKTKSFDTRRSGLVGRK